MTTSGRSILAAMALSAAFAPRAMAQRAIPVAAHRVSVTATASHDSIGTPTMSSDVRRGSTVGAVVGLGLGVAAGLFAQATSGGCADAACPAAFSVGTGALTGAAVGAALGALMGRGYHQSRTAGRDSTER